jgi:hypothetical protein
MLSWTGGRLGYRYGLRPLEKIAAFSLTIAGVIWFAWKNQDLFRGVGTGLLLGVLATFIVNMLGVSPKSEAGLLMAAIALIGLKFGAAAFGMGLLGWLLLTGLMFGIVLLTNRILYGPMR